MIKRRKYFLFGALAVSLTLGAGLPFLTGTASAGGGPLALVVDTLDDTNDDNPDTICADVNDECSLRAAIETLEQNSVAGGTITFAVDGVFELGSDFELDGAETITVTGNGVDKTIISTEDGGRHFDLFGSGTHLVITDLTLRDGNAVAGGSIRVASSAKLTADGVHFLDNGAEVGGAISADAGDRTVEITNSTFAGNTAIGGGAIHVGDDTVTVTNSTFTGNIALDGAAILAESDSDVTIDFSTFSQNSNHLDKGESEQGPQRIRQAEAAEEPGTGGVIYAGDAQIFTARALPAQAVSGVTISNSILEKTTDSQGDANECGGIVASGGGNIVDDESCSFAEAFDLENTASNVGALADNGGPTFTMALPADSAAVDVVPNCTLTDQRGQSRNTDGNDDGTAGCDSGAYELATPVQSDPTTPTTQGDVGSTGTAAPATPTVASPRFTG